MFVLLLADLRAWGSHFLQIWKNKNAGSLYPLDVGNMKSEGTLITKVHRKHTLTQQYINWPSKKVAISGVNRATSSRSCVM